MEIVPHELWWRNIKTYGNKVTKVRFATNGITLIQGDNGVGKTTMFDALCFVWTGKSIRKETAAGNLVSAWNNSDMEVTHLFTVDGTTKWIIQRGMKPGKCLLWSAPIDIDWPNMMCEDYSTETRSIGDTSDFIRETFRINESVFRYAYCSSTRVTPFFEAGAAIQKEVTESVFGFDELSYRAKNIKKLRDAEEVNRLSENTRSEERRSSVNRLEREVETLRGESRSWVSSKADRRKKIESEWDQIDHTIDAAKQRTFLERKGDVSAQRSDLAKKIDAADAELVRYEAQIDKLTAQHTALTEDIDRARKIDVDEQLAIIDERSTVEAEIAAIEARITEHKRTRKEAEDEMKLTRAQIEKVENSANCPTCGQKWPDDNPEERQKLIDEHKQVLTELSAISTEMDGACMDDGVTLSQLEAKLSGIEVPAMTRDQLIAHGSELKLKQDRLAELTAEIDGVEAPDIGLYEKMIDDLEKVTEELERLEKLCQFQTIVDLDRWEEKVERLRTELAELDDETDPYAATLERALESLEQAQMELIESESASAGINRRIDSMKYLEALLTRKDSPIRQSVLATYLPVLNERMSHYLEKMLMRQDVIFKEDLSVEVVQDGAAIHPTAISGGEDQKVGLALTWAFRDVFEQCQGVRYRFMGIDERLDTALRPEAVENVIGIVHEMSLQRELWLITHRREFGDLASREFEVSLDGKFAVLDEVA